MGMLTAAIVWYVVVTIGMGIVAVHYDRWITAGHLDQDEGLTATAIMTSLLVALGVFGVEVARVLRLVIAAMWLADRIGWPRWQAILILAGSWAIDSASAWASTGLPMIRGNCWREAMARREREAIGTERTIRVVEEAALYGHNAEGGGEELEAQPGGYDQASGPGRS